MEIKETKYFFLDRPVKSISKYLVRYGLSMILSVIYRFYMDIFYPKTVEKKYNVSICAIFRNEAKYLKEWINFHLIVGVNHFYLYNNFSEDDYLTVLQPFIDAKQVTLIDWPIKQGQLSAYEDCINKYCDESEWIGFIDLDEFVVPNKVDNIYDFLKPFQKNRPAVLLYWKYFGTSGKMRRNEENLVMEDFVVGWSKYENMGKCFFNTKYSYNSKSKHNLYLHHCLWGTYKGIDLPPVNIMGIPVICNIHRVHTDKLPIQINHYVIKSANEYWNRKAKLGGGTHDIGMHDEKYFYYHELRCNTVDYSAFRFLVKLKERMGEEK